MASTIECPRCGSTAIEQHWTKRIEGGRLVDKAPVMDDDIFECVVCKAAGRVCELKIDPSALRPQELELQGRITTTSSARGELFFNMTPPATPDDWEPPPGTPDDFPHLPEQLWYPPPKRISMDEILVRALDPVEQAALFKKMRGVKRQQSIASYRQYRKFRKLEEMSETDIALKIPTTPSS